jgi:hypothetical protein
MPETWLLALEFASGGRAVFEAYGAPSLGVDVYPESLEQDRDVPWIREDFLPGILVGKRIAAVTTLETLHKFPALGVLKLTLKDVGGKTEQIVFIAGERTNEPIFLIAEDT